MVTLSCFDIQKLLDKESLPFVLKRLNDEEFSRVTSLDYPGMKDRFKEILKALFEGDISFQGAYDQVERTITPSTKPIRRWGERLVRTEASKIFTLGYGDYLLSIGETECYIPHSGYIDLERDCILIEDKVFSIKEIQDNIYKNYDLEHPIYPTVPLHPSCRHVITKKTR